MHAGKEDSLSTYLHFLVETTLLGHIAYTIDVICGDGVVLKPYVSAIRHCHAVDHADKCGLSCAVRPQQTVNGAARNLH